MVRGEIERKKKKKREKIVGRGVWFEGGGGGNFGGAVKAYDNAADKQPVVEL